MRPKRTAEEMFPLAEAYLQGGITKKEFCARHAVPESVLGYWLAKYRRQTPPGADAFLEITPEPAGHAFLEVSYPSGVRLRLFSPVAASYLEALLRFDRRLG
jgi:transposase-like protein